MEDHGLFEREMSKLISRLNTYAKTEKIGAFMERMRLEIEAVLKQAGRGELENAAEWVPVIRFLISHTLADANMDCIASALLQTQESKKEQQVKHQQALQRTKVLQQAFQNQFVDCSEAQKILGADIQKSLDYPAIDPKLLQKLAATQQFLCFPRQSVSLEEIAKNPHTRDLLLDPHKIHKTLGDDQIWRYEYATEKPPAEWSFYCAFRSLSDHPVPIGSWCTAEDLQGWDGNIKTLPLHCTTVNMTTQAQLIHKQKYGTWIEHREIHMTGITCDDQDEEMRGSFHPSPSLKNVLVAVLRNKLFIGTHDVLEESERTPLLKKGSDKKLNRFWQFFVRGLQE